jgi:hypothetical protein
VNVGQLETLLALEKPARRCPRPRLAGPGPFAFHPNVPGRDPQVLRVPAAGDMDGHNGVAARGVTGLTAWLMVHRS